MGISLDRVMAVGGWSNTNRGEMKIQGIIMRETPTGQAAGTGADFVTNQEIRNEGYKN